MREPRGFLVKFVEYLGIKMEDDWSESPPEANLQDALDVRYTDDSFRHFYLRELEARWRILSTERESND